MGNTAEDLASKVMGAVKSGKAALEGLSGVFRHLAQEHGEVSALLYRVSSSSDPALRAELFPKIRKELLSHEKGEISIVYPALREHPETVDIAEKHDREASALSKLIDTMSSTTYDDPTWEKQFSGLVDLVKRHVAEEENDFFPKGQKALGDERSKNLLSEYEQVKSATFQALG